MPDPRSTARVTGLWYLGLGLTGMLGFLVVRGRLHDPDDVVVWSGWAEIALGTATVLVWPQPNRARLGVVGAAFFLAVFPGNVSQWLERKDGFGLDTDQKRMARLAFQPVLMAAAVYAGDRPGRRRLEAARRDPS